jgi:hypothetical protein
LFSPETVHDFTDHEIARLATESEEIAAERVRCTEKLAVLEAGLRDLKRLDKHRTVTLGKSSSSFESLFNCDVLSYFDSKSAGYYKYTHVYL